jgi:two-component system OmpR family sensor kinase
VGTALMRKAGPGDESAGRTTTPDPRFALLREPGTPREPLRQRRRITARGRMILLFVPLLISAGALSVIGIRAVLIARVDQRVDEALEQEVDEVIILLTQGTDPETGEPFADLTRAFDVYFERNVPSVQEAHVAFVGSELLRSRLRSFPIRELPPEALAEWSHFATNGTGVMAGEFEGDGATARYRAVSVRVGDDRGAFVVAIMPAFEMREIRDLQTYGTLVVTLVVILAAICAWTLSDRILAPVRELTDTARSISETDRGGRVRVNGSAEAADMARHFNAMLDRLDAVHYSQLAFLAAVGHELRTPLTVATGHLEMMDDDNPERRATVELVIDELSRMARLVDDLQTLAEAERDDYVVMSEIALEPFARELLTKAVVLGDRRWQLDELHGQSFRGDRERITEAVLNLVDNAVKHTDTDDEIGIGASVVGGLVKLTVRDTGPGLDPSDRDRVFERFERGGSSHRRYRGSGLGLTITRVIARAHGGDVTIEPSDVGAVFCIRLPADGPK